MELPSLKGKIMGIESLDASLQHADLISRKIDRLEAARREAWAGR